MNLDQLSYYRIGGSCRHLHEPSDQRELLAAMAAVRASGLPWFVLGAGSNSLIADDGWPGHVIALHRHKRIEILPGNRIRVGAGVANSDLVKFAYEHELSGLEWMNGLPGQVGGTVRMNARCYGGEISRVVVGVQTHCNEYAGQLPLAVFRGYKDTDFMTNGEVISEVTLQLRPGRRDRILAAMTVPLEDRTAKGQFEYPSCGCVFKNNYSSDVSVPSGLLLDLAGVRQLPAENLQISARHANFVFNTGGATASNVLALTQSMREKVYQEFGVWLAYEMEILGDLPAPLADAVKECRTPNYQVEKLAEARSIFQRRQGQNAQK